MKNSQILKENINTNRNGFEYLNSNENDELFDEILKNVKLIIPRLGNLEYKNTYKKWLDFHDNRENTMLENISSYVENNELDSAVFLCGSGHRKSILSKIKEKKHTQLEWHFELPK